MQSNKVETMDSIIQGQTQSALVQKLSETEHNVKRLTHDILDQAPLVSKQMAELEPYMGDVRDTNAKFRFKVPRQGYLDRMYLKVFLDFLTSHFKYNGGAAKPSGMETFGMFFEHASLFVNGKRVETLYPESVMYNTLTHNNSITTHLKRGLNGIHNHGVENQTNIEFSNPNISEDFGDFKFLIPLEFSLFKFFKDSVDTNFLGDIEVEFKRKPILGTETQTPAESSLRPFLSCSYHNFKNTFRTNIRNANYSKQVTSFLHTDSFRIPEGLYSEKAGTNPIDSVGIYKFDLGGVEDISEIVVGFTQTDPQLTISTSYHGEYSSLPSPDAYVRFILRSNGKVILDKFHYELISLPTNPHAAQIHDLYKGGSANVFGFDISSYDLKRLEQDQAHYAEPNFNELQNNAVSIITIPMSLFGTDEFYNGVLSLKSLTNVELEVQGQDLKKLVGPFGLDTYSNTIPTVVLRSKKIARIDGKTGNIHV